MNEFLEALDYIEYCQIGDTYALTDEESYNELIDILEENNIPHKRNENSYVGIYMIKLLKNSLQAE